MARVRRKHTKNQRRAVATAQPAIPLDDGTVTTPAALAFIQALIPLGMQAVQEQLLAEVLALAGRRYARDEARPDVVRWGAPRGSIVLADQQRPIPVPRVRDRAAPCEVPLAPYRARQTPRAHAVGVCRTVRGGLAWRESDAAAAAVPAAFGLATLATSSGSRRFIRATARRGAGSRSDGSRRRSGWCSYSTGRRLRAISA